ncbi:MAG: acyl carrier protein [Thermoguttaceae bacterium]|nr:acyl carrier protein [Thermoguttaceae bacterium]
MEDFIAFIAKVMEVDPLELNEETTFGKYKKWDSVMHMRLVMEVEEEYDVEIPIDEVPNIKTLKQLFDYTKK